MFTIKVIFFSLFPLVFFGIPVTGLLFPDEPFSKKWVKVPFLGMAFVVLLTQNLVYADIPVKQATPWIWSVGGVLWLGWLFWEYRRGARPTPIKFSTSSTFITAFFLLAVYVVQGFGLLVVSARYYAARAWMDQFNYVSLAQFLMDYPFSTPIMNVLDQPYVVNILRIPDQLDGFTLRALIHDRIGQSIYHAFVASSSNGDAKTTFEATILLLPILASIAIYWIARENYSPFWARLALLSSGMLPSFAMLHLESFLSQSLGIPILFVLPFFINEVKERWTIRSLISMALILSAGISIYTEFFSLYMLEIFLVFFAWFGAQIYLHLEQRGKLAWALIVEVSNKISWGELLVLFTRYLRVVFVSFLFNAGFFNSFILIIQRVTVPGLLSHIYPWSFRIEGFNRLWFGDWSIKLQLLFSILGVLMTLAAYSGLFMNWVKQKTLISFTYLTLSVFPLPLFVLGSGYMYQFYKMLLTISPLYILGVIYWIDLAKDMAPARKFNVLGMFYQRVIPIVVILIFLLSGASTFAMTSRTGLGSTMDEMGLGGGHLLQSQDMRDLSDLLDTVRNVDVLISYNDNFIWGGNYINGWISYLARHNRVYLTNPLIFNLANSDGSSENWDLSKFPAGSVLISSAQGACEGKVFGSQINPLLDNNMVRVGRISDNNWAFIDRINNPNGLERDPAGAPFFWIGNDPASMIVYSGNSMLLKFHLTLQPGPSLSLGIPRTLKIGSHEIFQTVNLQGQVADLTVEVPVSSGRNEITFQVVENPTVFLENDPRTLLIMFSSYCRIELVEK